MTIVKIKGQQTSAVQGGSEGSDVFLRGIRDGSLVTADWRQAAIIGGYGYMANISNFLDAIVGGGNGTVIDVDTPDAVISVPQGTCIMPLKLTAHVQPGAPSNAQEVEALWAVDYDTAWDGTAGSTEEIIYNMNTLAGRPSTCTAVGAFTSTITSAPAITFEIARVVMQFSVATAGEAALVLDLVYEPKTMLIINGPAMLLGYYGGDTATVAGFMSAQWLEFPEGTFKV